MQVGELGGGEEGWWGCHCWRLEIGQEGFLCAGVGEGRSWVIVYASADEGGM